MPIRLGLTLAAPAVAHDAYEGSTGNPGELGCGGNELDDHPDRIGDGYPLYYICCENTQSH
jgi:hypothetical protein